MDAISRGLDQYGPMDASEVLRLRAAGAQFVGGYLFSPPKGMTLAEIALLGSAGIRILSYYERTGSVFTESQGWADAADAFSRALDLGQPRGSCIFFTVDVDADQVMIDRQVLPYFRSIHDVMNGDHQLAAYGSGLVLRSLVNAGLITHSVLAGATGWRGYADFESSASVVQHPPSDPYGIGEQVDPLEARVPLEDVTWDPAAIRYRQLGPGDRGDDVATIQSLIGVSPVDGIWGPRTEAIADLLRSSRGLAPGQPMTVGLAARLVLGE